MSKDSSSGLGTLEVLQLIFIVLKCANLVAWSWPAVLIPLWIEIGIWILEWIYLEMMK